MCYYKYIVLIVGNKAYGTKKENKMKQRHRTIWEMTDTSNPIETSVPITFDMVKRLRQAGYQAEPITGSEGWIKSFQLPDTVYANLYKDSQDEVRLKEAQQIEAEIGKCNQDLKRLWAETEVIEGTNIIAYDHKKIRRIEDYRSDLQWQLEQIEEVA